MRAEVLVYYGAGPNRSEPFRRVMEHLDRCPFPVRVCLKAGDGPWCLAPIVNPAVEASSARVIVLNAPDTLCPIPQMIEAVRLAEEAPGLVYAFTDYVRLDQNDERGMTLHNPSGHVCIAIRRENWLAVGGYDEAYVDWGPDDLDFNRRIEKLWPTRRVAGEVLHLWHGDRNPDDSPVEADAELVAANWKRFKATA